MFRHSIFVKIYLCFWLSTILVLTSQMVLNRIYESGPPGLMGNLLETSLSMYGHAALASRQAGSGKDIIWLTEQLKETSGIDAFLLDESGNRLDSLPVGEGIRGIVAQALSQERPEHLYVNDKDTFAISLPGQDGKQYVVVGTLDHPKFRPPLHEGKYEMALRIFFVLIISGLVFYLLTRYLVSPLIVLRDAARRFSLGELSIRVSGKIGGRKDETSELAQDFDLMAERIESLMHLQRQLIGDISHELRSPLARLCVALDLARQKSGPAAQHALNRIEEEALELNNMIGELLTMTRLESGNASIQMTRVDVAELVKEIAKDGDFEAQGSNRGVHMVVCDECVINGNRELLRGAIDNVVRNAISHTDENTEVEISVTHPGDDYVQIAIRDFGPGVAAADLDHIFRPFYRTSQSRERQTGGTGLGLAISERAVKFHHGTVTAENAIGRGLVVRITVPTVDVWVRGQA